HTGAEDHLCPQRECEIAQSEAATGKPFVRYWLHVRFLRVDSERMAKSKGGFYTLDDVIGWGYDPLAFRLLALGAGYRNGLDFTRGHQCSAVEARALAAHAWCRLRGDERASRRARGRARDHA